MGNSPWGRRDNISDVYKLFEFEDGKKQRDRRRRHLAVKTAGLGLGLFSAVVAIGLAPRYIDSLQIPYAQAQSAQKFSFSMCSAFQRDDCVIDGDTIRLKGRKIRLADINAPEKSAPQCAYEKQLADQATKRLLVMLNEGPVVLRAVDRDQDRYGRDLRVVLVNGRSVGSRLVDEGLAETWTGRRRNWC